MAAFCFLSLFCIGLIAEDRLETVLVEDAEIYEEASEDSRLLGRLPAKTVLYVTERQSNGYFPVFVELQKGGVSGWIPVKAFSPATQSDPRWGAPPRKINSQQLGEILRGPKPPAERPIRVPQDEGVLLRRETTFLYGVMAGGSYGLAQSRTTDYLGLGFQAAGYVGFHVSPDFFGRLLLGYSQLTGVPPTGPSVDFGFFDVTVAPVFLVRRFEIFAGFQYSAGLGVSGNVQGATFTSPTDLSSFGVLGGGGYRIPTGASTSPDIIFQAFAKASFQRSPVGFLMFGLNIAVELKG